MKVEVGVKWVKGEEGSSPLAGPRCAAAKGGTLRGAHVSRWMSTFRNSEPSFTAVSRVHDSPVAVYRHLAIQTPCRHGKGKPGESRLWFSPDMHGIGRVFDA
jgi:hypothetical protein